MANLSLLEKTHRLCEILGRKNASAKAINLIEKLLNDKNNEHIVKRASKILCITYDNKSAQEEALSFLNKTNNKKKQKGYQLIPPTAGQLFRKENPIERNHRKCPRCWEIKHNDLFEKKEIEVNGFVRIVANICEGCDLVVKSRRRMDLIESKDLILKLHNEQKVTMKTIAEVFECSPATIFKIISDDKKI